MKKLIFLISLVFIGAYSSVASAGKNDFDRSIMYPEIWDMYDLQIMLNEQEIPFLVSPNGYIYYKTIDKDKVEEIKRKSGNRPSISFEENKFANLFIALLLKKDIAFQVRNYTKNKKVTVIWKPEDNAIVRKIIDVELKEAMLKGVMSN